MLNNDLLPRMLVFAAVLWKLSFCKSAYALDDVICSIGTYSSNGKAPCLICPDNSTSLVGASFCTSYVSTQSQLEFAISNQVAVVLVADIYLSTTISIVSNGSYVVDGQMQYKIDGQNQVRCMSINAVLSFVQLSGLRLINGYTSTGYGGAILVTAGSLSILNSSIESSSAVLGGGICLFNTAHFSMLLYVVNSTLSSNTATSTTIRACGGGVYGGINSNITMITTSISKNFATTKAGGGIVVYSMLRMTDCDLLENSARVGNSGSLYVGGGYTIMERCIFQRNSATGSGGALYLYGGVVVLNDCVIEGNIARAFGGGLYAASHCHSISIHRCTFHENNAQGNGAGLRIVGGQIKITDSLISKNIALLSGGGMSITRGTDATVTSTSFFGNFAGGGGGGLYNFDATLVSRSCVFENNTAGYGGAFFVSAGILKLVSTLTMGNMATIGAGGGILIDGSQSSIELNSSNLVRNTAQSASGGGIYMNGGECVVQHSMVAGNQAHGFSFEIISGKCWSRGGCFYSPHYPRNYGNYDVCSISVGFNGTLSVESFATEEGFDFLTVDGIKYSGVVGPQGIAVRRSSLITFASDILVDGSGFKVCNGIEASGGGIYSVGGVVELKNVTLLDNMSTDEGGGIHIDGGSLLGNKIFMLGNRASEGGASSFVSGSFDVSEISFGGNFSGKSLAGAVCKSPCSAGEYGECQPVRGTSNCFTDCLCFSCPPGSASAVIGAISSDVCVLCGAGSISNQGETTCSQCPVGRFATDNSTDMSGGLISQVVQGATYCNLCPAGLVSKSTSSLTCEACEAGKTSVQGSSICQACAAGKLSPAASKTCVNCETGKVSTESGSGACIDCGAGSYSPSEGSTFCSSCPPGRFQSQSGTSACLRCSAGKFAQIASSLSCSNCEAGYTSLDGSTVCDEASVGYYLTSHMVSKKCQAHATCDGGKTCPKPDKGFWMDRDSLEYNGQIYSCLRGSCIGSQQINNTCWSLSQYSSSNADCVFGSEQCSRGSTVRLRPCYIITILALFLN